MEEHCVIASRTQSTSCEVSSSGINTETVISRLAAVIVVRETRVAPRERDWRVTCT